MNLGVSVWRGVGPRVIEKKLLLRGVSCPEIIYAGVQVDLNYLNFNYYSLRPKLIIQF